MKTLVTLSILVAALILAATPVQARRGNPTNAGTLLSPKIQYYIVDSDETDDPNVPTYTFLDTLYDPTHWHRVTNFTNNDDGYGEIGYAPDSIIFVYMDANSMRLPPRYISTNGMMKLTLDSNVALGFGAPMTSPANEPMPTVGANGISGALICPLWADMEFRTTGDSSKVFYRMTADSCFVTYYNLFLKGTNGGLSTTFQVVFSKRDSSITFHYRDFNGTFNLATAAQVFQDQATVGVQNNRNTDGTMYFDRGTYYAISSGSQLYAKPLHAGLAVRFERVIPNRIRINSIDVPPYDGYELLSNSLQPKCTVENFFTTDEYIWVKTTIIDLSTGLQVVSCTDSVYVYSINQLGGPNTVQFTACLHQGFPCGKYRMTMTATVPSLGTDAWTQDNIMTRDFELINTLTAPFYDNFDSITTIPVINPCNWHTSGATWVNASSAFCDPPSPNNTTGTGAILLNRRDANGNPYPSITGSDSIVSSPIDIHGLTNVWLSFSYQRGLCTDSMIAGIQARSLIGPEAKDYDNVNNVVYQGDSLLVEGLLSTAPKLDDTAAGNWSLITTLYGGLDYTTQQYRVQLNAAKFVHDHFRIRIRLMAKDDHVKYGYPLDDDDNWLIDNVQVSAPANGQTDLQPVNVSLGAGNFTHIPRNVKLIAPVVTIGNNGLLTNSGAFVVHLRIKDALNRAVYDKTGTIVLPAAHSNSLLTMPVWDITGSQGGTFLATVDMEQNWNEYYKKNDTATFSRNLFIDSAYALDDGVPDASGTMTNADNSFYYDFTPLADDSLRGVLFYHTCPAGNTNWAINIIDTSQNNKIVRTIAFSYNVLAKGFIHSPFVPFFMKAGQMYRLQCTMTQGTCLGGDASYGYMWETTHNANAPAYSALHPDVVSSFRNSANVDYVTANKNAAAGGPILPMIRLKFGGSSTFLPVELMNFSAARTDLGSVNLAFQTAKEESVDHFAIDRETSSGWVSAGNIPAKNERLVASYSLLDEKAPSTSLTYRLMEVDLDGSQKLLGTTAVGPFGAPEAFGVQVNPNPTSQNIHVTISGTDEVSLKLYDVLGKVVASKEHATGSLDIDASALSAGSYWLDATSGENHSRVKVSVTR